MTPSSRRWALAGAFLVASCVAGCNGGSSSDSSGEAADAAGRDALPTASLGSDAKAAQPAASHADDPEALIGEITRLLTVPDKVVEVRYQNGQKQTTNERPPTDDEILAERRRRLEQVIELSAAVITKTYKDAQKERIFNNAVHYLADTRRQLALIGDEDQAHLLADDAEALYERDPTSFAAVETAYKLLQLAEAHADRYGRQNTEWVRAYANQARLFVEKFPQEQGRAAVALISAGRKCEQFGLYEDARQCFLAVEQKYPGSPYAQQVAGVLRRLRLPGQPLELAGPTIDGGFVSIEHFAGKALLVVFWATNSETFTRDLPTLQHLQRKFGDDKLAVLGVNLDQDELAVDQFLARNDLHWRQIFFSEADKRGGRSPLARHYGVHVAPTYWLVNPKGVVVAAPADLGKLQSQVTQMFTGP